MNRVFTLAVYVLLLACFTGIGSQSSELPRLARNGDRYALIVDGRPFLILGAQLHNSSAWPAVLPEVWPAVEFLHANTVEAPVYWEQLEPEQDKFDFTNVDAIVQQSREHKTRVILLWFGTWKNARDHYVPSWIKLDPVRYPRLIDASGRRTDSLSPFGAQTLAADQHAFAALLRHLKQIDSEQHTVLMIQVENEAGSLDSVRDFSPAAQVLFNSAVPDSLLRPLHKQPGTWTQVFGSRAPECFEAYAVAHYIDQVAASGKAEFPLPMYVNAWIRSPGDSDPDPSHSYPSGGAVDTMLPIYKATVHSIDFVAPDIYLSGDATYLEVIRAYSRPDNALFVPENANRPAFSRYCFAVLGLGGIGFSVFGVDHVNSRSSIETPDAASFPELVEFARVFALFGSAGREIAALNFEGRLKAVLEGQELSGRTLDFDKWRAIVSFEHAMSPSPNSPAHQLSGAVLVAELSPGEFLVTGFDADVAFKLTSRQTDEREQFLSVEEGAYENGQWIMRRMLNGDESEFQLDFTQVGRLIRIKLGTY